MLRHGFISIWKYITESGTENLRISLKIIEAYLLLCPNQFMHVCIQYSHYLWSLNTVKSLKIQYYKTYRSHNPYLHVDTIFWQNFCNSLASSLHSMMSDIREEGQILILRVRTDQYQVDKCIFSSTMFITVSKLNSRINELKRLFSHPMHKLVVQLCIFSYKYTVSRI